MVRFLPFLISLALSVYALFSCIQTRNKDVPYLPKLVWILLIVFVPFVGPIVWLLMARGQGTPLGRAPAATRSNRPAGRPLAPDDDPDFLASLERYRDPRTTVRPPKPGEPKAAASADNQAVEPEADKPKADQPDRPQDKSDRPQDRPAKAGQDEPGADNASDSPSDTDGDR